MSRCAEKRTSEPVKLLLPSPGTVVGNNFPTYQAPIAVWRRE